MQALPGRVSNASPLERVLQSSPATSPDRHRYTALGLSRPEAPWDRPVSVAVETAARFALGALCGAVLMFSLTNWQMPTAAYAWLLPLVAGLARWARPTRCFGSCTS